MADKIPLKGLFDSGGNVTGLAEYRSADGDTLGVIHGGTGLATITANKILTGNGTSAMSVEANLTFDGSSNTLTTPNVSITTAATLASAKVSDLTDNRVVLAGTAGELEDSGNLTFDGSTLAVTGNATVSGNLTVTGTVDSRTQITSYDPVMILNAGASGTVTDDAGLVFERGSAANVAIYWDESEDYFEFATTTDIGTDAIGSSAIDSTGQAAIKVGNITSTGNIQLTGTLQFDSGQTIDGVLVDAAGATSAFTSTTASETKLVTEAAVKTHVSAQASAFAIALG